MEYINIRRYYDNFHVLNIFSRYSYDKKIIQSKFFIYRRNYEIHYGRYKDTSNSSDELNECSSCVFLAGPFNDRSCSMYISCSLMDGFIIEKLGGIMTLFLSSYIRNNSNNLVIIDEL
mgnify:FL=1